MLTIVFVLFVECTCFTAGTVNSSNVCEPNEEGLCTCKKNVEGLRCMSCKDTYYDLREDNIDGCTGDLLVQDNKIILLSPKMYLNHSIYTMYVI